MHKVKEPVDMRDRCVDGVLNRGDVVNIYIQCNICNTEHMYLFYIFNFVLKVLVPLEQIKNV